MLNNFANVLMNKYARVRFKIIEKSKLLYLEVAEN